MSPTYLMSIAALTLVFIQLRGVQTASMAILIIIYLMQFQGQNLTAP